MVLSRARTPALLTKKKNTTPKEKSKSVALFVTSAKVGEKNINQIQVPNPRAGPPTARPGLNTKFFQYDLGHLIERLLAVSGNMGRNKNIRPVQ